MKLCPCYWLKKDRFLHLRSKNKDFNTKLDRVFCETPILHLCPVTDVSQKVKSVKCLHIICVTGHIRVVST